MNKVLSNSLLLLSAAVIFTGCGNSPSSLPAESPAASIPSAGQATAAPTPGTIASNTPSPTPTPAQSASASHSPTPAAATPGKGGKGNAVQVVAQPDSITALVNKQFMLPDGYEPTDLVYPDVPFTFNEKIEKRKMRKEAASALEKLFQGAKKDGIQLASVSAYRSRATQKTVFDRYVKTDGEEKARTYSAVPGHSEHQTGLAVDVTGSDGKCAAQDCFGGTKEAKWLEAHAAEYGFIIRYPKGKEAITGYQYEPWHIRYLGAEAAKEITGKGITLEEYYNAVPVSK